MIHFTYLRNFVEAEYKILLYFYLNYGVEATTNVIIYTAQWITRIFQGGLFLSVWLIDTILDRYVNISTCCNLFMCLFEWLNMLTEFEWNNELSYYLFEFKLKELALHFSNVLY